MSTHNVCGCTSEDCRVNGCLMKRQRNEAGGFYAADSADCGCGTRTGTGGSMTTKHTGGPAFPMQYADDSWQSGMSLRDYFAAKVCAALMTVTSADHDYPNLDYQKTPGGQTLAERVAEISYRMADAMLAARENT